MSRVLRLTSVLRVEVANSALSEKHWRPIYNTERNTLNHNDWHNFLWVSPLLGRTPRIYRKAARTMSKRDDAKWADNLAFHRATLYGIRKYPVNVAKPHKSQPTESMESQFRLRRSADSTRTLKLSRPKPLQSKPSHGTRQRIRRREPLKIQRVTVEEIQQRIRRECIRQQEKYR